MAFARAATRGLADLSAARPDPARGLASQSGGALSEIRAILGAVPFVVAFLARPGDTAKVGLLAIATYVVASRVADLRPGDLDRVGLGAALEEVARGLTKDAPDLQVDISVDDVDDTQPTELLFAVGRELLANAIRHSDAESVALTLERRPGALVLEVADDGRGIDSQKRAQARQAGHIGLDSVLERVAANNGETIIDTAAGSGTSVTVVMNEE